MEITPLIIGFAVGVLFTSGCVALFFWLVNVVDPDSPDIEHETDICWECTGSGWMIGDRPCKVCRGKGTIPKGQMVR